MPGLEDLYREIILDHYRTPRNRGELPPPAAHAVGHNPLCGDEIDVYLQVDGRHRHRREGRRPGLLDLAELGVDDEPGGQGPLVAEVRALVRKFKGMMSIEEEATGRRAGPRRRDQARRPRGAAGRRQVPRADQVRDAGLEHVDRGIGRGHLGMTPAFDAIAPHPDGVDRRRRTDPRTGLRRSRLPPRRRQLILRGAVRDQKPPGLYIVDDPSRSQSTTWSST